MFVPSTLNLKNRVFFGGGALKHIIHLLKLIWWTAYQTIAYFHKLKHSFGVKFFEHTMNLSPLFTPLPALALVFTKSLGKHLAV